MSDDPLLANSFKIRSPNETKSRSLFACLIGGIAAASIFCLIILIILLAIPITVFVIGTRYRDPRYCPIEPRISLFLIVHGSISLGWILFSILIGLMTMLFAGKRPFISVILVTILTVLIFLISIFSLIWLIVGSVWTFSVRNQVIHEYDPINHFYTYNYCHPVLYKFTYVYLIISYVLLAMQCCYQCILSSSRSRQKS